MHIKTRYFLVFIMLLGMPALHAQQAQPPVPIQNPVEENPQTLNEKIKANIDSLQNLLANKLRSDILSKYTEAVPGTGMADNLQIQEINSKSISDPIKLPLPGVNDEMLNLAFLSEKHNPLAGRQVQHDGGLKGKRFNLLTRRVDEQIIRFMGTSGRLRQIKSIRDTSGRLHQVLGLRQISLVEKPEGEQIDRMIDSKAAQMSEFKYLNDQTKELPESMLMDLERYNDEQALMTKFKNTAVEKTTDYFTGHMDKITQAQGVMSKLKNKYSFVPNSRDMSTATKASSLKNESIKKRLVFGFGFKMQRTDPISLDLSPNLMYRFNKLFSAGVSGTYRVSLGIENSSALAGNTTDVYGASAIVQHRISFTKATENKVWKGFFGHGEFEYMSTPLAALKTLSQQTSRTDQQARAWHKGLLLGIGKQMNFSRAFKGQIIFTYDFLHTKGSPNPKAWNIKFGFIFGKIRLKDLRI